MAKKRFKKNKDNGKIQKEGRFFPLPRKVKKIILGYLFILLSVITLFSIFQMAGPAGSLLKDFMISLAGTAFFVFPLVFALIGLIFFKTKYKRFWMPALIGSLFLISGFSGIFQILNKEFDFSLNGGFLGKITGLPLFNLFDIWISVFILSCASIAGILILKQLLEVPGREKNEEKKPLISRFKKVIGRTPSFVDEEIGYEKENKISIERKEEPSLLKEKNKNKEKEKKEGKEEDNHSFLYNTPPVELLEFDKGAPSSGDTKINSAIIQKTLENFDIFVEMSEINTGPTVTQYTLKPAEGIKLSKITSLSNDLSLSLAAYPIRIEAPIPGRSLVGIEIPNKIRAEIRMRNLIDSAVFKDSSAKLPLVLGKDVSGHSQFANLEKMPHMLVAGATGTGKTIFLNVLILSLLYKNTPATLRLILIDPKRVEFSNYGDIPHLLAPIIYDVNKTCNALKWLVGEMERRLEVMSKFKARDIIGYNEMVLKNNKKKESEKMDLMPYIVLVIDELADLMSAKGREVEAGIVRLAQMARAAGIHLILATQRPSVEVITGLIKANVTSRVTFQVASQVDSRTVLDTSGAEKLLGSGDLLFISGEISRPKRIQGPFVSEKEIREVVKWIKSQHEPEKEEEKDELSETLEKNLEAPTSDNGMMDFSESEDEEDSLYEEAKKIVVENKKASASFLQRRMRIGYARAARLLDILEERGVIGPGDGAKPREIYHSDNNDGDENDNWQKI